jgi:hypothetical protein
MFTQTTFAAVIAATIVATAPVPVSQSTTGETTTKASSNITAQDWCSGPRQHIDFRCR